MNDYVIASGKIYQLHNKITRSKTGKEYKNKHVKITVATDFYSGKQIQHDYTGKNNFEVQTKIDDSICLNDEQLNLIPNELTFKELCEEYFEYKKTFVCDTEIPTIRRVCETYVYPKIGNTKIKNIKKEDIINLQHEIHNLAKGKSLSLRVFYIIKPAMEYACKKGYISYNPCLKAKMHRYNTPEQTILDQDQIYKLLVEEKECKYAGLYAITFFMALRIGEAIGLSWDQINWESKTVVISQQLKVNGQLHKYTKTKINRCITIPNCVFLYLKRQKEFQETQRLQNPKWNNQNNFIFTYDNGKPFSRSSVEKYFKNIMKNTSNPNVSLHSLRRTIASILAENISIQSVKYYLGHVRESTSTKYIYPSKKDVEHLSSTMNNHFSETFIAANLMNVYLK